MSVPSGLGPGSGDAFRGALGCVALTVLLLAWAVVVSPIEWLIRAAGIGLAKRQPPGWR